MERERDREGKGERILEKGKICRNRHTHQREAKERKNGENEKKKH